MKVMTDAQRLALEEGRPITEAGGHSGPAVSADARYVVQWLLAIFVLLPLVAGLVYILSR